MEKNIDSELFELMFQLSKNIKEKLVRFSAASNITMQQFLALSFIEKKGNVHMKDIAEHFAIEMSTATSLLNKLARHSLIKREIDKNDRRIVKVSLNKKGDELLQHARKIQEGNIKKMLSYLSDGQKKDMHSILKTLIDSHVKNEK